MKPGEERNSNCAGEIKKPKGSLKPCLTKGDRENTKEAYEQLTNSFFGPLHFIHNTLVFEQHL